jgi:hypothetical protein
MDYPPGDSLAALGRRRDFGRLKETHSDEIRNINIVVLSGACMGDDAQESLVLGSLFMCDACSRR